MWKSPRYDEVMGRTAEGPAATRDAPEPAGETLAEIDRNQGRERLRISRESFNGHEFIRCQVWELGTGGHWWPVKGKVVTFKLRELPAILDALGRVDVPEGPKAGPTAQNRPTRAAGRPDARSHVEPPQRATNEARPAPRDWREGHVPLEPRGPVVPGGLPLNGETFSEFGDPSQ